MNRAQRDLAKELAKKLRELSFNLSDALIKGHDDQAEKHLTSCETTVEDLRKLME